MKKILISIFAIILMISLTTVVNAASTGSVMLTVSNNTIKPGDSFTVTASATDSNNLNTVEYAGITITDANGNVTTDITVNDINSAGDSWAKMANGSKTAFVYGGSAIQSAQVFKITFSTSENIKAGKYTIQIEGLTVYSAKLEDDTTVIGNKSISVDVVTTESEGQGTIEEPSKEEPSAGETQEQTKTETTPSNTDDSSSKPSTTGSTGGSTTTTEKTTASSTTKNAKKLPQTGLDFSVIIAIVALGVITVGSYVSYKKYKEI